MFSRTMLKSKIHRATVTQADLHYVGSVTLDADLMEAADLLPGEQVAILNITNGARLETYVIEGERGSGVVGINGAAAHKAGRKEVKGLRSDPAMNMFNIPRRYFPGPHPGTGLRCLGLYPYHATA